MSQHEEDLEALYSRMQLRYRVLVRLLMWLPVPRIPFIIVRKLPLIEGILHGIVVPVFVFLVGLFIYWLIPTMTLVFGFPLNIIITLTVLGLFLALFARIELERSIRWWRGAFGSPTQGDPSKALEELVELFKKQQNRKAPR
ncbi:MAG TPA: hypothetical protein VJ249_10645 [Candidatus Bathyarchaeia archaeon]|nr:hypothetical protein [Candidatus Bathyarchaeia archaeon]